MKLGIVPERIAPGHPENQYEVATQTLGPWDFSIPALKRRIEVELFPGR
jgi:hypothetical protein